MLPRMQDTSMSQPEQNDLPLLIFISVMATQSNSLDIPHLQVQIQQCMYQELQDTNSTTKKAVP